MKNAIYYLTVIVFALASCDPMQDINDELEHMDKGYQGTFSLVLTSDDYGEIADLALEWDPSDTENAAMIAGDEYFNDEAPAARYIPMLIPEIYPALGKGSSGMITYNYNAELPEDLTMYTEADEYEVTEDQYTSLDEVLDYAGYFSPSYPPEVYIPAILKDSIEGAQDGDLLLVEYMYSTVDPQIDLSASEDVIVFLEAFTEEANGLGFFSDSSMAGDQVWGWDYHEDGNAKMSGFSGGPVVNEDWLISGSIDLSDISVATLYINQAINYLNDQWDQINIYISTDYDGSDISGATWEEVSPPNMPSGSAWDFVESGPIDISSYAGQSIYIAFKYLSSDTNAATWEVAEVRITTPGSVAIIGLEPQTYKAYYECYDDEWYKAEGVYHMNAVDYDAMGSPGKYNNFSSSDRPADYIPALLLDKFPLAGQDQEVVVVYKYYAGTTLTLASTYTMNGGQWESSYDYVEARTDQFIYGESGWVFDPTVTIAMGSSDYQIIVDWVAENITGDYVDSYGTGESYCGAGAYYANFDIRPGYFEDEVFESWEEAVEFAIGSVLLPARFPGATTQMNGADMYYVVNFATYSGADGSYSMKFQVTKSAPDPEFTLTEGPD